MIMEFCRPKYEYQYSYYNLNTIKYIKNIYKNTLHLEKIYGFIWGIFLYVLNSRNKKLDTTNFEPFFPTVTAGSYINMELHLYFHSVAPSILW